ncbi:restriction endonuclease subunit S [Ancylothrix sp. C2]|uniref:restriction endonuclease subunit S n=1 Tax=Ancylothrix sp. D3o TaxID=2953691 RepID=UPI0021BB4D2F|nr:restriction endonuclease subunit S [Ancylothrix sp. D3o]MCT7952571.1 restriction endonuclease subunit S [Ancylothrix sp. D3o]
MDWLKVHLSKIATVNMGQSPPTNSYNDVGKGLPLFQGKLEFGAIHPTPIKWCTEPRKIAQKNDILMSVRAPIGQTNIADQICCIGGGLAAIRAKKEIAEQKYLYWLFKFIEPSISDLGQGSAFKAINRSHIESISIPLPTLSEQHRIVEILDQADALRRKRLEADQIIDRILPSLFIKMFGDPATWDVSNTKPLGELINIQGGGTPSNKNLKYWEGNTPWVSLKDMKQDIIYDSIEHISDLAIKETNLKYIESGAILILVRGMILAHTIPIAIAGTRLTINEDMKAISPKGKEIDSTYLQAALKASSKIILAQVGTAGHGYRKLDTQSLLNLPIFIPSQQELNRFQLSSSYSHQLRSKFAEVKIKLEILFQTLQNRAFSGELTAKWREDHFKELLQEMEHQAKLLDNN